MLNDAFLKSIYNQGIPTVFATAAGQELFGGYSAKYDDKTLKLTDPFPGSLPAWAVAGRLPASTSWLYNQVRLPIAS
jgi:hypothetical protein